MVCLDENTFQQLVDGTLPVLQTRDAWVHFNDCRSCRQLYSALALGQSSPAIGIPEEDGCVSADAEATAVRDALAPGTRVGRFIVQGPLGAGGMGVVHAAEDPVLGRKVALKLIHADHRDGSASNEWRVRLLREARAIARLSHPNVITVHDIGIHGEQLFVAMELVEGATLRSWLAASPRSWRDVVSVFVAAGRGLLAAHRAGLVHRDFKPDNVLIGNDGRIRVTDFGLACPIGADSSRSDGAALARLSGDGLGAQGTDPGFEGRESRLTQTGVLVGTPGYIAPEVLRGGTADIASDQFSFCVTLHEALFREHPFAGSSSSSGPSGAVESSTAPPTREINGRVRTPSDLHAVPGWLQQIVERGLCVRPEDRFPGMESLLAALDREPIWRRPMPVAVGLAMVVAGGISIASVAAGEAERDLCTGAVEQVAGIWHPGVSAQVHASFAAAGRPHASSSADRVSERLDLYTGQWAAMHRAACLATARGEQSPDLLDRRLLCLGRRLDQVAAVLDLFVRRTDGELVDRAIDLVDDLDPLSTCADSAVLLSRAAPPTDPMQRARVAELERQADRAELERQAGHPAAAAEAARAVLDAERALEYAPLAAHAGGVLGRSLDDLGKPAEARDALDRAQRLAHRGGDITLAMHLMLDLLVVVGVRQERYGEAQLLGQLVEGALERPELRGDEAMRARLFATLGSIATRERKVDRAIELQREVLAIRRRILPPMSEDVASAEENLGIALRDKTRQDEARPHYFEALAIRERLFGAQHPLVANVHINLGVSYLDESNAAEARKHLFAALAILEQMPSWRSYHHLLNNLGELERTVGDHAQSRRYHEAALAVRMRQLGPDHPSVALSLHSIGNAMRNMGELHQALAVHRRALAIFEKSAGTDHPRYANCLAAVGEDLRRLGRAAESLSHQERALKIIHARSQEWDSAPLLYQGLALLDLGRGREAIPMLTRARERFSPTATERARAAFGLARALEPHRPTSPRTRALAQEALATFTARRAVGERDQVAAYLARGPR